MSSLYIINNGQVIFTPAKDCDLHTMTVNLGEEYYKLRYQFIHSDCNPRPSQDLFPIPRPMQNKESCSTQKPFLERDWHRIGKDRYAIDIYGTGLRKALYEITSVDLRRRIEAQVTIHFTENACVEAIAAPGFPARVSEKHIAGGPCTKLFYGVLSQDRLHEFQEAGAQVELLEGLHCKYFSITCMMAADHTLEIVVAKTLSKTSHKKVQEIRSIWSRHAAEFCECFPQAVRIKSSSISIKNEAHISERLIERGVPYIMPFNKLPTVAGSQHGFLGMKLAEFGDFASFSRKHYDPKTGCVLQDWRGVHLLCMYRVAQTLVSMHKLGVIYGDVKAENILVLEKNPLKICLTDFGLTRNCGDKLFSLPGSYPSPEFTRMYHRDLVMASYEAERLKMQLDEEGARAEISKRRYEELHARHGVTMVPAVDEWAFGILLLKAMYSERIAPFTTLLSVLRYDSPAEMMEKSRDILLQDVLNKQDPAYEIIAGLLCNEPSRRMNMEQVCVLLSKLISV